MKKLFALVATASTAVGVLAGSPARAADGTPTIAAVGLSTTSLVVDGDAACPGRVTVTVKLDDPQQRLQPGDLDAAVFDGAGRAADVLTFDTLRRTGAQVTATDVVQVCGSLETPGRYRVDVQVTWLDEQNWGHSAVRSGYFTVRRPTTLSYDATPEPVRRGGYLTHRGRLMFDPYSYGPRYGASGATVKFYFKKHGATTYAYQGSAVTGPGGHFSRKLKARDSGLWKVVYAGTDTRQPQAAWDQVRVKR